MNPTEQFRAAFQPQLHSRRAEPEASSDVGSEQDNRDCNSRISPERHRGLRDDGVEQREGRSAQAKESSEDRDTVSGVHDLSAPESK